jgi:hypothetical protein
MSRFTLEPRKWYAMEILGPEFGENVRHCSPIEVHSLKPAGGGKRCLDLTFYHAAYSVGVQNKTFTLQTIKRSKHFLLASVVGTERLALFMELTDDWLKKNFEHSLESARRDKKDHLRVPSGFDLHEIFGASKKEAFGELHWSAETMSSYGLPNIGYPVPHAAIKAAMSGQIEIGFEELLYWLQLYTEINTVSRRDYATAMTRLAEVITNEPAMDLVTIEGQKFWLELGEVDLLRGDIVTIQRGDELVGAFQRRKDGTLRFAAYQPLDAKAIGYATGLALRPAANGTVCMRPDNWEYALDCSAGNGNFYAADRGASYLSRWEFGLGISSDGSKVEHWYGQRGKQGQEPRFVATQIEVYQEFQHLIGK